MAHKVMTKRFCVLAVVTSLIFFSGAVFSPSATDAIADELWIVRGGQSDGCVLVADTASQSEKDASVDLQDAIYKMTGATIPIIAVPSQVQSRLDSDKPALIVGDLAFSVEPGLRASLQALQKKPPILRADAIVLRRVANRVYIAGSNPESHAYAVSELLHRWGCRWYLPTMIGECIPESTDLKVENIDYCYAPPFEVRRYWLSWLGDTTSKSEFMRHNFFNDLSVPNGHILGQYTKELVPPGKSMFNVPIAEDRTAQHVAEQVLAKFTEGQDVQLGMEDGIYESDSPIDKELIALQFDKYFQTQSYTDAFMTFYNKVAKILQDKAPASNSHIGFLAYSNITLPPLRINKAEKPLVAYLAPIDFDPIHSMDDPRSASRRELKEIMYRWSEIMEGRLVIYDYDQSMLVWRDIPNPSHQAFSKDVQHYRKAGILGVDTESRGATATTFLNLYVRGQLLWNPDQDVQTLLDEFYPKFYGPAADPMKRFWTDVYNAWENTLVSEHEYFVAPAIYSPELIRSLHEHLKQAEMRIQPSLEKSDRNSKLYVERMRFARKQFDLLEA
ncbi:MAG: DUF4838 domain-containing protein, partial [Planctomycetes bacterium]|nr:DUF4838 domain-containing protein [Planctomycetota bacterium]